MIKVLVNGTFDILHAGHVSLFEYAKSQGDFLLVAIDSDDRVRKLKGISRPITKQHDRQKILESIKWIDKVVVFDSNKNFLKIVRECDVMVKGSDYKNKSMIEQDLIQIIFYDRTEHSTTNTIQDIIARG